MDDETTREIFIKPAIVGATGTALSFAVVPWNAKMMGMPAPLAMGLVMAASSCLSATTNEIVYENLMSESDSDLVYDSTAPLITGVVNMGAAWYLLGGHADTTALMEFFALGVVAEVGGGYIDEKLLGPALDLD